VSSCDGIGNFFIGCEIGCMWNYVESISMCGMSQLQFTVCIRFKYDEDKVPF